MTVTEADLARTSISLRLRISPVEHVGRELSRVVADYSGELIGAFYSQRIQKKANAALTELVNNVLSNAAEATGYLDVALDIGEEELCICVSNHATPEQALRVENHLAEILSAPRPKDRLKATIHERRSAHLSGGLGLLRLVAENQFELDVTYRQPILSVSSRIRLGGLH